ncbi:ferredoxin--NADP reductase [Pontibacter harenae]|uniref:ferredoxin--NADP reductase n=1 Tax=Pontibacter harenae TaxID=2894083 RepID=UPI001E4F8E85|nr:ferredoxin--NADP reductase [Pontibacter harenae]MCC9165702.1 ferredoxin--NADP reductase [Pontibacter harenae]
MSSLYFDLQVAEITRETADAITIHLEHPEKKVTPYKSGQFLTLILPINGQEVRRSYSLSSTPEEGSRLSVTVKRVAGGLASSFLIEKLKVGDTLKVMEPLGNFCLTCDPAEKRHIILFGAGSGITPLMSILKSVLTEEPASQVTLLYGNRDESSVIFKEQLRQLQKKFSGRLHIEYIYSQSSNAPKPKSAGLGFLNKLFGSKQQDQSQSSGPENVHYGRMNQSTVIKILERLNLTKPANALYFVCGPQGMMEEVLHALNVLHVPKDRIYKESFITIKPANEQEKQGTVSAGEDGKIQPQAVTLLYEGAEYSLKVQPSQTILEAALKEGIDLPYSCQAGLCTACRGKCLSGKVHLDESDGLSEAELEEGYVLNCVGHPLTDDVIIQIG